MFRVVSGQLVQSCSCFDSITNIKGLEKRDLASTSILQKVTTLAVIEGLSRRSPPMTRGIKQKLRGDGELRCHSQLGGVTWQRRRWTVRS